MMNTYFYKKKEIRNQTIKTFNKNFYFYKVRFCDLIKEKNQLGEVIIFPIIKRQPY